MKSAVGFALVVILTTTFFSACGENFSRSYSQGLFIYQKHCQNCHGKEGEGLVAMIPPLTDSLFLKQNRHLLGKFIKYGVYQPMQIKGENYNSPMPENSKLNDKEIAQVILYITNSFGNKLGMYTTRELKQHIK